MTDPQDTGRAVVLAHGQERITSSLGRLLGSLWPVRVAHSGDQALDSATAGVGVVITDLRLPDMSAPELTRRLREVRRAVDVVWITSYAGPSTLIMAVRMGVFDYVELPCDCAELLRCIDAAMQRHWSPSTGRTAAQFGPFLSELLRLERAAVDANPLYRWRRRAQLAPRQAAQRLGVDVDRLGLWETGAVGDGDLEHIDRVIEVPGFRNQWSAWERDYLARLPYCLRPARF